MLRSDDTIAAVSSPPGRSRRGLIRVSGPGAGAVGRSLLRSPAPPARTLAPARLVLPGPAPAGQPRVPVLVAWFPGPRSYTGQDLLELQCPGHPALLERILRAVLAAGARRAEAGEFTFRAFLNGKMDLTQAEGVAAAIAAVSDGQLAAAGLLQRGELGRVARDLVDRLGRDLALVEAGIDFTDQEDVVAIAPAALLRRLIQAQGRVAEILQRSGSWRALEALPRVVLCGPPNVGKSTLFNALLGRSRAVTSDLAGTTRDVLEEALTLTTASGQRVEVLLVDLAGLDTPVGALDRQAQAAAREAMARADLLLLLSDGGPAVDAPPGVAALAVRTKCDRAGAAADPAGIAVSARTGAGLDRLRQAILAQAGAGAATVAGDMLVLQPRHEAALTAARDHLARAAGLLQPQTSRRSIPGVELVALELRAALDELAALGGQMTPDDVLGRVFATFCVGK